MSPLATLIRDRIRDLSGSEFKIAVLLYRRLGRSKTLNTTIAALAQATGLSWRQTESALRSLHTKGVLVVEARRKLGTRCSLPHSSRKTESQARTRSSRTKSQLPESSSLPPSPGPAAANVPFGPTPEQLQTAEANALIRRILDYRHDVSPRDFKRLLQEVDGDLGRLIRRLERMIKERYRSESVEELGANLRRMVLVR